MDKETEQLPKIKMNPHQVYRQANIGAVLAAISEPHLPRGELARISRETGIPSSTLSDWRRIRKLQDHENWYPNCNGHPNRRMLDPETENELANEIANQAASGLGPTAHTIHSLALEKYARNPNLKYERFCASTTFVSDFMKRHGLSFRKPHGERRTTVSEDHVRYYQEKLENAFRVYPKERIFNMDETCWKISNTPLKVVNKIGVPTVKISSSQNQKISLTAIATIDASGAKLPIWIIAKGKTSRCETKFGKPNENLIFCHTVNGWATEEILISYLEWIHAKCNGEPCFLIWDVYAAHRAEIVQNKARELNIELLFVPAGGTSQYQPLDVRIFGELKSRARKKFEHLAFKKKNRDITYEESISILLKSWEAISQESIEKSWKIIKQ